ncbi:hypothetical protein GCM10028804_53630 [Larkinella terrae]
MIIGKQYTYWGHKVQSLGESRGYFKDKEDSGKSLTCLTMSDIFLNRWKINEHLK